IQENFRPRLFAGARAVDLTRLADMRRGTPRALDHRMAERGGLDEARRQQPPGSAVGSAHCLPLGLLPRAPSQAKSGTATIFGNELDAGSFKCPSNDL